MYRLAVLTIESAPSRLVVVPETLWELKALVGQLGAVRREQVVISQVKDDRELAVESDSALQTAVGDTSDALVLTARVKPGSEVVPTTNYVVAFTARHKLRVYNLDTETVTYWESKNINWTGRACVVRADVLIFTGGNTHPNSAFEFDLAVGKETQLEYMKKGRMWHGVCALGEAVYAVGGREETGGRPQASTEVLESQTWRELPPLNTPRESMTLLSHLQAVLAFGGFDGDQRLTTIEKYENEGWTVLSVRLPAPRQMPGVLLSASKALVVGGQDSQEDQTSVFELDLDTGELQTKTPLPVADFFTGRQVVKRGEQVWAFGRKTYVLAEDRWSSS